MHWKQILGGLALLSVAGIALWLFYTFAIAFSAVNPAVQSAFVAAFAALSALIFTYWKEKSRSFKEAHRDKKIEAYSEFYDIVFEVLEKTKEGEIDDKDFESKEFQSKMMRIMRNVIFYGSPEVVLAFSNWKAGSGLAADKLAPYGVIRAVGRLLLAMRSDIGLSNRGLTEMNIHQVYVTDDLSKFGSGK